MGMTISEKILAKASGKSSVSAGEIVSATPDWIMTNDATTHISIEIFKNKVLNKQIAFPERTIMVIDHNVPSESIKTTHSQNLMRQFAKEYGLNLYDGDGICHQILIENHINPGDLVIGADSHTCSCGGLGAFGVGVGSTDFVGVMVTGKIWLRVPETIRINVKGKFLPGVSARDLILKIIGDIGSDGAIYKSIEFHGETIKNMSVSERITLCNLCVEAGAKTGIIEPDEKVLKFLKMQGRKINKESFIKSDKDAKYEKILKYDVNSLEPIVTKPHTLDNAVSICEIEKENIKIDQAFIGSCSAGRIEDLRDAAKILRGRKVHPSVRLLISPASREVYIQAIKEGIIEIFLKSGAVVLNPNCSVCWGATQGILGDNETMISTGTRNFKGRAGSPHSFIYLASSFTVAASAIAGRIIDPRKFLMEED